MPSPRDGEGPLGRFLAWRGPTTSFVVVTTIGTIVVVLTAVADALLPISPVVDASASWIFVGVGAALALVTFALGDRVAPYCGYLGAVLTAGVCGGLMLASDSAIFTANTMLLAPLIATYLAWFFPRWLGRITTGVILAGWGALILANPFPGIATTWINMTLVSAFCFEALAHLRARLYVRASTDALTGVLNRNGLQPIFAQELERAQRADSSLSIAMVDLDGLKLINDTRGHAEGDRVLRSLVDEWRRSLRPFDRIARIGGDEFLILLPGANLEAAALVLARLAGLSSHRWSFGVAMAKPGDSLDSIVNRADERLYVHKSERQE